MNQPIIATTKLLLRPFRSDDARDVQILAGNKNVSATTMNIPYPYKDGMAELWISRCKIGWTNKTCLTYAITDKTTSALIGAVSLFNINETVAELGYWMGEPYWNNGYCTEAAKALTEFAVNDLGLTLLNAKHLSKNRASGRVMEKIGMQHVQKSCQLDRNGRLAQMEVYELLRTDAMA